MAGIWTPPSNGTPTPPSNPPFDVGKTFVTLDEAKAHIMTISVAVGLDFRVDKHSDNTTRWITRCKDAGCGYRTRVYRKDENSAWIFSKYSPHTTCSASTHLQCKQGQTVAYLKQSLQGAIFSNRKLSGRALADLEFVRTGNRISTQQANRAKAAVMSSIHGNEREQYTQIPALLQRLRQGDISDTSAARNGKAYATWDMTETNHFERCFVAPYSCCKLLARACFLLYLDGTNMKTRYGMTLLIASMHDRDNKTLPLAWALVPSENYRNWRYFCRHLLEALGAEPELAVMSDRDKGLHKAVKKCFPHAHHYHCCQHLAQNILDKGSGTACQHLFWRAARTPKKRAFDKLMDEMLTKPQGRKCYDWLQGWPRKHWALHAIPSDYSRFGHDTSNVAESINAQILDMRSLPPIQLLKELWYFVARQIGERQRKTFAPGATFTTFAQQEIDAERRMSKQLRVSPSIEGYAIVSHPARMATYRVNHLVDERANLCECRYPMERPGLKCSHMWAVADHFGETWTTDHEEIWTIASYRESYANLGLYLPDFDDLQPTPGLEGPNVVKNRGRQKTRRFRKGDARREKRAYKCSHCGGRHASRFCKEQGRDTELEQLAEDSDSSDSDTETDRDQDALTVIPEPPLPPNNISVVQRPQAKDVRAPPTCSSCHQQGHSRSSRFCPDKNNLGRHRDEDDAVGNDAGDLTANDTRADILREFEELREGHSRLDEQMESLRHLHAQKTAEVGSIFTCT